MYISAILHFTLSSFLIKQPQNQECYKHRKNANLLHVRSAKVRMAKQSLNISTGADANQLIHKNIEVRPGVK